MDKVSSLLIREGQLAVARSLEVDIAAQGATIAEALRAWAETFAAQILVDIRAGREPLSGIGPAPERCFEQFRRATRLAPEPLRLPDEVPESWMFAAMRSESRVY